MMTRLVLPFPLRPNYKVQIVIPSDMTKDEADRLCKFVMSIAIPEPEIVKLESTPST